MKIYQNGSYGRGTILVTPANLPGGKTNSDWVDRNSGVPLSYTVRFHNGMADVDDQLGEIMIAEKLAFASPALMPDLGGTSYRRRAADRIGTAA